MTWIKLDDKSPRHPKIASLSDRAFRWWVIALCYASEFLTDGILPKIFWKKVPNHVRTELTNARLWLFDDPNLRIHDYLKHQSNREDVEADKERNREKAKAFRERRKTERRSVTGDAPGNVTGDVTATSNRLVTDPENREQRTDTENREQTTATPSAPRLVSGEANPKTWGKIHGDHVTGFCDWVCFPEFIFAEFSRKSAGAEYVREWAAKVRSKWQGKDIGDNLKFWRTRWSESHLEVVNGATKRTDQGPEFIARLEAIARGERKR